eukprot:scaffold8911_cov166-Amphora_coffeaeformis.AAC.4
MPCPMNRMTVAACARCRDRVGMSLGLFLTAAPKGNKSNKSGWAVETRAKKSIPTVSSCPTTHGSGKNTIHTLVSGSGRTAGCFGNGRQLSFDMWASGRRW